MKIRPILDECEKQIIAKKQILDWPELRDMIDIKTGQTLSASALDTATQQLVNRLHKRAPQLLEI